MPKAKPQTSSLKPLSSWHEAEAALGSLRDLDITERQLRAAADEQIKTVRDALAADLEAVKTERGPLAESLEAFVAARKFDFSPACKHRDLLYGRVGVRDEVKYTWPKIPVLLARLRQLRLSRYVRVYVTTEPKKQAIMGDHDKLDLAALGVKRKTVADVFYFELKR